MVTKMTAKPAGNRHKPTPTDVSPLAPVFAAFLFIPGREWVLFGDFHVSIEAAQAALMEQIAKFPQATDAWVCEVKAKRQLIPQVIWA